MYARSLIHVRTIFNLANVLICTQWPVHDAGQTMSDDETVTNISDRFESIWMMTKVIVSIGDARDQTRSCGRHSGLARRPL